MLVLGMVVLPIALTAAPPEQEPTDPRHRYRFGVLGGVTGITGETPHYFGAFEAAVLGERFGGFAQAQGGGGTAHASVLVEGGLGTVLAERGRFDLLAHAGPGLYLETISTGTRRWTGIAVGGLSARIPLRTLTLAAGVSVWRGRFSGPDFEQPMTVEGLRVGFGIGWGWRS
jgi:hypothetical protein